MKRNGKLAVWASEIDDPTRLQAERTSRLPFIHGYVALMPDAHFGMGSTVGSVIPTLGAIIPAAVGVDIGCGMIAANTGLTAEQLPNNLDNLMPLIEQRIPAGVGKGHSSTPEFRSIGRSASPVMFALMDFPQWETMSQSLQDTAINQMGTLGSGNHFVEVCLDENNQVWVVLHSGSRGVGNKLAAKHIAIAKDKMEEYFINLEDVDLAYLVEGSAEFDAYIGDLRWAQGYAYHNREVMMAETLRSLGEVCHVKIKCPEVINCHHNYTVKENHHGKNVWLTRKGAISARAGEMGVIPGSMGTASYIVRGLGNEASFSSCSHGAGRRMSRGQARKSLTATSLKTAMEGKTWNSNHANELIDEHPDAYKDIDQVMRDQADLVEVVHTLHQIFNFKGAK